MSEYSDIYKDIYNVRPHNFFFENCRRGLKEDSEGSELRDEVVISDVELDGDGYVCGSVSIGDRDCSFWYDPETGDWDLVKYSTPGWMTGSCYETRIPDFSEDEWAEIEYKIERAVEPYNNSVRESCKRRASSKRLKEETEDNEPRYSVVCGWYRYSTNNLNDAVQEVIDRSKDDGGVEASLYGGEERIATVLNDKVIYDKYGIFWGEPIEESSKRRLKENSYNPTDDIEYYIDSGLEDAKYMQKMGHGRTEEIETVDELYARYLNQVHGEPIHLIVHDKYGHIYDNEKYNEMPNNFKREMWNKWADKWVLSHTFRTTPNNFLQIYCDDVLPKRNESYKGRLKEELDLSYKNFDVDIIDTRCKGDFYTDYYSVAYRYDGHNRIFFEVSVDYYPDSDYGADDISVKLEDSDENFYKSGLTEEDLYRVYERIESIMREHY